jgi:hypothetical protein
MEKKTISATGTIADCPESTPAKPKTKPAPKELSDTFLADVKFLLQKHNFLKGFDFTKIVKAREKTHMDNCVNEDQTAWKLYDTPHMWIIKGIEGEYGESKYNYCITTANEFKKIFSKYQIIHTWYTFDTDWHTHYFRIFDNETQQVICLKWLQF